MNTSQPEVLFSMSTGYAPLTNLLGAGDPNVHWIDGRWWMFFGAFRTTLRNNIFAATDRKSTRLNSSHVAISYAVFCLKKKKLLTKNTYSICDQVIIVV